MYEPVNLARPKSSLELVNCASVSEIGPLLTAIDVTLVLAPKLTRTTLVRSPPVSLTAIDSVGVPGRLMPSTVCTCAALTPETSMV